MWGGHNLCCNASGCAGWDPRPWHLHGCPQGAGTTHRCPLQLGLPPKSRGWGSAQWVRQFSSSLITSLLGCFAEQTLHTGKLMLSPGQRWSRLPRHLTSQPWPGHSTHREGAVGGEAVSWNEKCTRSSLVIFLTKFAVSCLNAGVRHRHLLADLRSAAAILCAGGATPGQLQRGQTTSSQHWETSPVRGEICVPSPRTQGAGNKHKVVNAAGGRAQSRFGGRQGRVAVCIGILLPVITSCTFLSSSFYSSSYISQFFGSLSLFMSLTGSTMCTVNTRTLQSR